MRLVSDGTFQHVEEVPRSRAVPGAGRTTGNTRRRTGPHETRFTSSAALRLLLYSIHSFTADYSGVTSQVTVV